MASQCQPTAQSDPVTTFRGIDRRDDDDEAVRVLLACRGAGRRRPRQPGGGRLLGSGAVRRDAAEPVRERVRGEGVADGGVLREAQVPRPQLPVPVQGRRQPEAPRRHQAQAQGVHLVQGARAELLAPSAAARMQARTREAGTNEWIRWTKSEVEVSYCDLCVESGQRSLSLAS